MIKHESLWWDTSFLKPLKNVENRDSLVCLLITLSVYMLAITPHKENMINIV